MKYNLQDTREYKDIGYPAEIKAQEIIKKMNYSKADIIKLCYSPTRFKSPLLRLYSHYAKCLLLRKP